MGHNLNLLLPEGIHTAHSHMLRQQASLERNSDRGYQIRVIVYIVKKNKYCSPC